MKIYAVELVTVDEIDEDGNILGVSAVNPDDLYTQDIYEAFENFKSKLDQVHHNDELSIYELTLECDDESVPTMNEKQFFEKYGSVKESAPREIVAQYFNSEYADAIYYDVAAHMLRQSSKYFNMHEICKEAGVNYSTWRGFKNNKQYFSDEKMFALLNTMNRVGVHSWNDDLVRDIADVEQRILVIT